VADEDKHSKTEQPTSKTLEDARKKGVPHSKDLTSTVTLIAAFASLYASGGYMVSRLKVLNYEILGTLGTYELTEANVYSLMARTFGMMGQILLPFLLTVLLVGIVASLSQGEITFNFERLAFDASRFNPIKGVKRIFNKEAQFELVKSIVKLAIVGYIAYKVMRDEITGVVFLAEGDVESILAFAAHIIFKIVLHTCGVMMVLAAIDLAFVKWRFIQNLKMTKQEVKDEHKDADGNPQVKGKMRAVQYERTRRRLKQVVPTADVIITNPTHYAIALKYDRDKMAAPIVLAKGVDFLAQKIKEIGRESNVILVENRFLARELYAQVEEGQEIPETLYTAVAEILAYVYSIKGKV
jgi:flagellar biosynthetic protein FlhB